MAMAHQPTSTILITGGNGSLGSAIAVAITKSQPGKYHLVLTARSLTDVPTTQTSSTLSSLGASFEFQLLDLSSLENVRAFASTIIDKITRKELPPFAGGGIIHSAAKSTYAKGGVTKDGWNDMYGVNVLAPVFLEISLLTVLDGALIVNVSSATHSLGVVDYFSDNKKGTEYVAGETVGLAESLKRYGSCKLLVLMAVYALQRHLNAVRDPDMKRNEYEADSDTRSQKGISNLSA
jgi:mannan polymerase II complex ANP1 subunit